MIKVVNKYKHKPTDDDVYIGRGSHLGNPYTSIKHKHTKAQEVCNSREESVAKYEAYINQKIKEKDLQICRSLNEIYKKAKNGNVNLVCFCSPKLCHGDIVKKIVESKL